jgi:hypothetical protein
MQIVFLSNRPAVLRETLDHVRHFVPWADDVVVLAPAATLDRLDSPVPVTRISEEELLAPDERADLAALDHASRNVTLRLALARSGALGDSFISSDDDYRPLKPIAPDFFVEDGRYVGYASYDLALWRRDETAFDRAQHASYQALTYLGCEHLSYASHMPMALDTQILLEAFDAVGRLTDSRQFCEWTLTYNYGRRHHPDRFTEPRPFVAMCWPQYPHEWPFWVRPPEYAYENFYPELYEPGHLFDGIPTALEPELAERHAFEKMLRWYRFDLEAGHLHFPDDVANPWLGERGTGTGWGRRAFFSALRPVRRAYQYLALEERTQLAELAGAIARLERGRNDTERGAQ